MVKEKDPLALIFDALLQNCHCYGGIYALLCSEMLIFIIDFTSLD